MQRQDDLFDAFSHFHGVPALGTSLPLT